LSSGTTTVTRTPNTTRQPLSDAQHVSLPDCFTDDYAPISGSLPGTAAPANEDPSSESGDWRQEVSARLQAHRNRRATQQPSPSPAADPASADPINQSRSTNTRRPRISSRATSAAATVAERYASAPSYSRYLESAGQLSLPDSRDDAHATNGANALDLATDLDSELRPELRIELEPDLAPEPVATGTPVFPAELAVTFDAAASHRTNQPARVHESHGSGASISAASRPSPHGKDLFEPTTVEAATALPANLIEFPRQLIAARKARPRLAEAPLRYAEPDPALSLNAAATSLDAADSQLRIFEVEPDAISHQPAVEAAHVPAWHGIQLDTPLASPAASALPAASFELPPQAAPISRRIMAALVDVSLVLFGYLAFITIFAATSAQFPTGKPAAVAAAALLLAFYAAYQWIFVRWSDATPGMRYARIGLCTFSDENPSRSAMQWRLVAMALSAAALGIGYLWALVDDDRLAWHDRISRVYLRGY
jgi:uncharacterized RDD family membrane protein YckC